MLAIADVELVAHDRIEQRVGAVQQLAVDYRVETGVGRNAVGTTTVPAQAMAVFGFHGGVALIIMGVEAVRT